MADTKDDAEPVAAIVAAIAAAIGLPLDPEYRHGVARNFAVIAEFAAQVMEFPLSETAEIGPVFTP
jgi:hypothetical protein